MLLDIIKDLEIEKMKTSRGNIQNNHIIIKIKDYKVFISYSTVMAIYNFNNRELYINSDLSNYTRTTSKFLKRFFSEETIYIYNRDVINSMLSKDDVKDEKFVKYD